MKRNQDLFDKIEGYLADDLPSEERIAFEVQMTKNLDLKQEVELHKSLHAEMKDLDALEFRKKIVQIGADHKKEKSKSVKFSWKIAASFLVLIGLSTYFLLQPASNDSELFETFYSPYPIEDVIRGGSEENWDAVLKSYSNKKYKEVAPKLKELIDKYPENEVFSIYLGNSYLNTDQEEQAIGVFESITKESKYYEDARWYLALTYTKINKLQKATGHLEWVVDFKGLHERKAADLLNQFTIKNLHDLE